MKKGNISNYYSGEKKVSLFSNETAVPFPQANDLSKVIRICEMVSLGKEINIDEISKAFNFTERQAYMYVGAGIYLGLIKKIRTKEYVATNTGSMVGTQSRKNKVDNMTKRILSRKAFNASIAQYLSTEFLPDVEEIAILILKDDYKLGVETALRRASTVLAWSKWVIEKNEIEDYLAEPIVS